MPGLQRRESEVLACVTEFQGDLEHPGEQLKPLGLGLHPHLAKPAAGSVWVQSIAGGSAVACPRGSAAAS